MIFNKYSFLAKIYEFTVTASQMVNVLQFQFCTTLTFLVASYNSTVYNKIPNTKRYNLSGDLELTCLDYLINGMKFKEFMRLC